MKTLEMRQTYLYCKAIYLFTMFFCYVLKFFQKAFWFYNTEQNICWYDILVIHMYCDNHWRSYCLFHCTKTGRYVVRRRYTGKNILFIFLSENMRFKFCANNERSRRISIWPSICYCGVFKSG